MDLTEVIRHNYLMHGLSAEVVERIAALASVKDCSGGDVIVRQFDRQTDLMIVIEGLVRINSFSGERIAEGGPGCIIGEISLLDDKPRSATVLSVGKTKLAVIPSSGLWKLMQEDPNAARTMLLNLGRVLCMRLRSANLQLDTVVGKNDFATSR